MSWRKRPPSKPVWERTQRREDKGTEIIFTAETQRTQSSEGSVVSAVFPTSFERIQSGRGSFSGSEYRQQFPDCRLALQEAARSVRSGRTIRNDRMETGPG